MINTAGPFHITLDADVLLIDPSHLGTASDPAPELVQLITSLISRHAEEGGFRLVGSEPLVVKVVPKAGPVS
jgi:hypothetical protein